MKLFRKSQTAVASLLFRGTIPSPPESHGRLESRGITITRRDPPAGAAWQLRLEHPQWGCADLACFRDIPLPPPEVVEHVVSLTEAEKRSFLDAGHALVIRSEGRRGDVLRDRKNLLRFGREALGDDGVGILDHASQLAWSPARLDEELQHDADLDIEAVHCLHAVHDDARASGKAPYWLHSHGLAELGAFDFDVLAPHPDMQDADLLRAIAFAIAEGSLEPSTDAFELASPGGVIRMVPVEDFMRKAPATERALRESDESHGSKRAVICEPSGALDRLFGRSVRSSRFLRAPPPENPVISFSNAASHIMAERARRTAGMLGPIMEEFASLELPVLVKLGYPTDRGAGKREHLWFQVHGLSGDRADATLMNAPYAVSSLREGARGSHDLGLLSDWMIFTPFRNVTPRNLQPLRELRERRPEVEAMLRARRS